MNGLGVDGVLSGVVFVLVLDPQIVLDPLESVLKEGLLDLYCLQQLLPILLRELLRFYLLLDAQDLLLDVVHLLQEEVPLLRKRLPAEFHLVGLEAALDILLLHCMLILFNLTRRRRGRGKKGEGEMWRNVEKVVYLRKR